ncbi:MAG: hypothetical protein E7314_01320 [Clostridiales bacterium]|nr:hypothetical protein [Clostridiales bacterium]
MKNKIFTFTDLQNAGLSLKDNGEAFFDKLNISHDYAIIIETGDFLTIVAKNGEKIIYNKTKIKEFTPELIEAILSEGDTVEKIDEILDKFNGKDTFGILMNKNGKPKHPSEYTQIIDDTNNQHKFNQIHSKRHINNDDYESR